MFPTKEVWDGVPTLWMPPPNHQGRLVERVIVEPISGC